MITPIPQGARPSSQPWLNLENVAAVQLTSEEQAHPIEAALLPREKQGWRASEPGEQTIRLIFSEPQSLRRIYLVFEEFDNRRTQEFLLRWSPDAGLSFREIVRQQWNFSPPGTTRETEDYTVDLSNVTILDLVIVPDISGGKRALLFAVFV